MYQFDAAALKMSAAEILGVPGLFTAQRIDKSTVPQGMYAYDLRSSEDRWMRPTLIVCPAAEGESHGTVLTAAPRMVFMSWPLTTWTYPLPGSG